MNQWLAAAIDFENIFSNLFEGIQIMDKDQVVLYSNPGMETISGYQNADLIGKRCHDSPLKYVGKQGECLCGPACPFTASLVHGETCEVEAYLHHHEGHRVPVLVRILPAYDETRNITGVVKLFRDNYPRESLAKELAELKNMATIDPLTELRNRRYAEILLDAKLGELRAGGFPFGLLFIDIDHFKHVNDTYGHNTGDQVLKMLAKTLTNNTRENDVLVRWGGEEIVAVIISPNIEKKLFKIAEKLRNLIRQSTLPMADGTALFVTVSIGATVALPSDTIITLVKRADQLMYQSKKAGRNCVTMDI